VSFAWRSQIVVRSNGIFGGMERLIRRENIKRYRKLLRDVKDGAQRRHRPRTVGDKVMILPTWSGTRQNNL
jgi:hypothetical protein